MDDDCDGNRDEGCVPVCDNDGSCETGETTANCPYDCVVCIDSDRDSLCDDVDDCVGENARNIPSDDTCIEYDGFNYEIGCWVIKKQEEEGTLCNSSQTTGCSPDPVGIVKKVFNGTCDANGVCSELVETDETVVEACAVLEKCNADEGEYKCICGKDNDNDDVCETYGGNPGDDQCVGENYTTITEEEAQDMCNMWILNESGCHDLKAINEGDQYNEKKECEDVEDCPERYARYRCNNVGGKIIVRSCSRVYQDCHGDPDFNIGGCASNFTKSEPEEILCDEVNEEGCWISSVSLFGNDAPCCGDDDLDECWIDFTDVDNPTACCFSDVINKVVYLTEPDESRGFCNLLGVSRTKKSDGSCTDELDEYCWDSNYGEHGACCGDDLEGDTWDEYSSNMYIGDVLVDATCVNGKWATKTRDIIYDLSSIVVETYRP